MSPAGPQSSETVAAPHAATVNDLVEISLKYLFPDQTNPDTQNHATKDRQFKAPDHSILNGEILIERKSRNTKDRSQFYRKIQDISAAQGKGIFGIGTVNIGRIIEELPNPEEATRKLVDFSMNQTMKSIREANRQFKEFESNTGAKAKARIVIISDHSQIRSSNATDEYFIGRKMGTYNESDDRTGDR
ncbi:MAG: hypothetical protein KL801_02160 [Mesorhizobium sp.]|nr:hypothetical protein [Mesorhizobium sp.]